MFGEKEWLEHAALVGSVTLAWNRNVHQLLRVFTHLTGVESPVADAIFFSTQSDSSQRRLIRKVAEVVDLAPDRRIALNALLKDLDNVSTGRNLAAHIIFGVTAFDEKTGAWGPKVVPALQVQQDRRLRDDFTAQFIEVEQTLAEIFAKLEDWLVHTPFPTRSWPGSPLPLAAAQLAEVRFAESASLGDWGSDSATV